MIADCALERISNTLEKMDSTFSEVVFDEWMVLSLQSGRFSLLHYNGPRPETIESDLTADMRDLSADLLGRKHGAGEFAFTREADGSSFDAFVAIGKNIFVIFNNTEKNIEEITSFPQWKDAQIYFVELSEGFRANPVQL